MKLLNCGQKEEKKALAIGQSPLQELEEQRHSMLYLEISAKRYIYILSRVLIFMTLIAEVVESVPND